MRTDLIRLQTVRVQYTSNHGNTTHTRYIKHSMPIKRTQLKMLTESVDLK